MADVVAGIDGSKEQLDVHVAEESRQFASQRAGYRTLCVWLEAHRARCVVMEATGRHHRAAHQALHGRGVEVVLANPWRARRVRHGILPFMPCPAANACSWCWSS